MLHVVNEGFAFGAVYAVASKFMKASLRQKVCRHVEHVGVARMKIWRGRAKFNCDAVDIDDGTLSNSIIKIGQ